VVQGLEDLAAEVPDAGELLPELLVQIIPRDELRLTARNTIQPLGEPDVHIQSRLRRRRGGRGSASKPRVYWFVLENGARYCVFLLFVAIIC
jgi:hypothetical protein